MEGVRRLLEMASGASGASGDEYRMVWGGVCLLTSVTGRHSLYPSYALLVHSAVLPTDMFLHGANNTVNTTMAAARLAMVKITYMYSTHYSPGRHFAAGVIRSRVLSLVCV